jgi:hypothetical protein
MVLASRALRTMLKSWRLNSSTQTAPGLLFNAIQAVEYATMMGADVSNNSWGGPGSYSVALEDAIFQAGQAGQVFVAAAGNNNSNNDAVPYFPSNHDLDNVISVAATDRNDQLSGFSNYGAITVDLGAPGSAIYSTLLNGTYGNLSGTSMATPHVTGAVALLKSLDPTLTPLEIRQLLIDTVDPLADLNGTTVSGGRLNVAAAIDSLLGNSGGGGTGGGNPPTDPSPTDDVFQGTQDNDVFNGYGGDDTFWIRYGDDTITGGTGADTFFVRADQVNDGDHYTITDLDFASGDTLEFRFFDSDTFDNAVDPTNDLFVASHRAIFDSIEDIGEAVANNVVLLSAGLNGEAILTLPAHGGDNLTLTLESVSHSLLSPHLRRPLTRCPAMMC